MDMRSEGNGHETMRLKPQWNFPFFLLLFFPQRFCEPLPEKERVPLYDAMIHCGSEGNPGGHQRGKMGDVELFTSVYRATRYHHHLPDPQNPKTPRPQDPLAL